MNERFHPVIDDAINKQHMAWSGTVCLYKGYEIAACRIGQQRIKHGVLEQLH